MMDIVTANAGLIGLLFFFIFFSAVVLWTFRPTAKKVYEKCALIPLEENENG